MGRLVAFVVALAALLCVVDRADACVNETTREEPAVQKLRWSEEALYDGDVERARSLATEVAEGKVYLPFSMRNDLRSRATRLVALSWIRDAKAMPRDIQIATEMLHQDLLSREQPDATRQADLGEAYARAGQDEAAYQLLRSLHEKDLIGSPYAYAALARVAAKRGDHARAEDALKRCADIASSSVICHGAYPTPPFLRGTLLGYALPGVIVALALVGRRRAKSKHPWSTFGDKIVATVIGLTCAFVFAFAYDPWLTTLGTFAVLALAGIAQRVAFLRAVKRERVPGLVLRNATAEDGGLPAVASFFHSGAERVLERVPEAGYREPARVGVLRLTPRRRGALVLTVVGCAMLALVASCAMLTAGSTKTASAAFR